jgi:phage FluMu protein Com
MDPLVTCANCGTKLRVRAVALRFIKEIQCTKCKSVIPIPPNLAAGTSAAPTIPATAAAPVAPPQAAIATASPAPAPSSVTYSSGTIAFLCASCGKRMTILKMYAGKKVKCTFCQQINQVPTLDGEAASVAAAAAAATVPRPPVAVPPPSPQPVAPPQPPQPAAVTIAAAPPAPTPAVSQPPAPLVTFAVPPAPTPQPVPAPSPTAPSPTEMELMRVKREMALFVEEELRIARLRVADLERRLATLC